MSRSEQIRDAYLGVTWSNREKLPRRMRVALEFLRSIPVKRYLDVGCGDGNFANIVREALGDVDVYGTDISQKAVSIANEKGIHTSQVDLSSENLPFESEFFDAVFAGEVIEHIFDVDHFLDEIYRVISKDGYLILTTPNLSSLYNRIALLFGYEPFTNNPSLIHQVGHIKEFEGPPGIVPAGDHIRVMTLRSAKRLLNLHSFQICKVASDEAAFRQDAKIVRAVKIVDTLVRQMPRFSFRIVIICKKLPRS